MIIYKFQAKSNKEANDEIKAMAAKLESIAPTLQNLQEIIDKHQQTITLPSIVEYRRNLQKMITDATALSRYISENTQMLAKVSEEAGTHLVSIEDYYRAVLDDKQPK